MKDHCTIHRLKIWPEYFEVVRNGSKTFEIRKDPCGVFEVGDSLHLMEWDPNWGEYTGREIYAYVTYVFKGTGFGLEPGYVVMSIKVAVVCDHREDG